MVNPWCISSLLQIHAEVDQVDHDLDMALGLHGATHHTETDPGFAVFGDESRDDGMERPLTGFI